MRYISEIKETSGLFGKLQMMNYLMNAVGMCIFNYLFLRIKSSRGWWF